jgi:hypothetical protein
VGINNENSNVSRYRGGLIATVPAVGSAQDLASNFKRDKNTSVRQRPRPDYEAIGVKTGGFTLYPRVTVEARA